MRNLFIAAIAAILGFFAVPAAPALAGSIYVDCKGVAQTACEAMVSALKRAPYVGPIRPASEPMACARIVSYGPVPVEWVAGTSENYTTAPVITGTAVVYTEPFALNPAWTVTESCIPRRLLASIPYLTLCTGVTADSFHWSLTDYELGLMKRTGHFTSYVPFLTVRDRESLSVGKVNALYSARYGAHY